MPQKTDASGKAKYCWIVDYLKRMEQLYLKNPICVPLNAFYIL